MQRFPREQLNADIYDCFNPRELHPWGDSAPPECRVKLFGNRNIGNLTKTNLAVASQLASDQTFWVTNWRARTNVIIDKNVEAAWAAWTNTAIATFTIGFKPQIQVPLSALLENKGAQLGEEPDFHMVKALAQVMWTAWKVSDGTWVGRVLDDRPKKIIDDWMSFARIAMQTLHKRFWVIPLRQHFDVSVDSDARATAALLEVLPTNVAPESLVWVHLEGFQVREVG